MNPEDIKRQRDIIEKATPAEMVRLERADFENGETVYELHGNREKHEMFVPFSCASHSPKMRAKFNAEFWLEARTAWPKCLDEIEILNALLTDYKNILEIKNQAYALMKESAEGFRSELADYKDAVKVMGEGLQEAQRNWCITPICECFLCRALSEPAVKRVWP